MTTLQKTSMSAIEPVTQAKRPRLPKNHKNQPAFIKYQQIRAKYGTLPKKMAMQLAGYSPKTDPTTVEQHTDAWLSIDKQRNEALRDLRCTFGSQLAPLVGIRDSARSHDADRIRAAHEINTMVPGMLAPERREISSRSIILELSGLSEGDLAALIEHTEQGKTSSCNG